MSESDKIDMLSRSYAAHGIRSAEDVRNYCRPPASVCCAFAVFGIAAAVLASVVLARIGLVPASWCWIVLAVVTPIAFGCVFALRAIFDLI